MKRLLCTLLLLLCMLTPVRAEFSPWPFDTGADCAAAYLGYAEDIGSFLRSTDAVEALERWPFLRDIPAIDTVVMPGCEIYCIVAAPGVTLAVDALDTASEAYPAVYAEVYRGQGPVLLIGNESDIMPNLQVRIITAAGERRFTPCMSLRDGSFAAHDPADGVYDFTLYPEGFVFEEKLTTRQTGGIHKG